MDEEDSWPTYACAGATEPDTEAGASVNLDDYDETLSFLRCFDTMFLIDDSAHMAPHWADVQALLDRLVPICARHDPDGVDLYFVNHRPRKMMGLMHAKSARKSGYRGISGPWGRDQTVKGIFAKVRPAGPCLLGARLTKLLDWYCEQLRTEQEGAALNVIVLTAGMFDDDVRAPLVKVARALDEMHLPEHQVGIQLFQIGGQDNEAVRRGLEYLDDDLHRESGTRDIVDTTSWSGETAPSPDELVKIVLGAVVKKLDQRSSALQLDKTAPAARLDNDE